MQYSQELFERACQIIPGGVNSPVRAFRSVGGTPFFTRKAEGCRLTTADGEELIDYVCTWGPAIHGHNHPTVREALAEALQNGTSFGTPGPGEVTIAETVVDAVPSIEMVRFCNSGTEAAMSAIRLARGYTGRDKVVKFAGCYHGHVDGLLVSAGSGALTLGHPDSAGVPASFAKETVVADYNDLPAVEAIFTSMGSEIAAIMVEPYPANAGLMFPDPGFLEGLRRLCTEHGALLIFDEVMTGFRLGYGGVQARTGIIPDMTALGKIIGGGLPVGAFGGKRSIMEHLAPVGPVYQAGTLSGNPLAMAAGQASLAKLAADPGAYDVLEARGSAIASAAEAAAERKGLPIQVPQAGSMFALFFADKPVRNLEDAKGSRTDHFSRVFHYALEHGVYLPPSNFETCFISTAHDDSAMERTCEVLTEAIEEL
jgi:glutamate-1-semialdehyde 2,1-aminomutase